MSVNMNRAMFPTIKTEENWMPPGSNPFCFDSYNMGVQIGTNVVVMTDTHENRECNYLYVVDTRNGHRIKISFDTTGEIENG